MSSAVETLTLFNEKASRLTSLSFFSKSRGGGAIVEFNRSTGWEAVFVGPDEESIEALVLTLRLFMQDNDRVSLRRMRELYTATPALTSLAGEFAACCSDLNAILDSDSPLAIEEGRKLTFRDILEIFVYGSYAHVSPRHWRIFKDIRTTEFFP